MATKPRVYGEQVKVRFCDNSVTEPIIIDFDSMETRLLITQEESYRTIGKSVSTHAINYEGYEITLTRNKRDPYIDSLILQLCNMARNRKGFSEFAIYKIVTHTYADSSINPELEMKNTIGQDDVKVKPAIFNDLARIALSQATSLVSNVTKPAVDIFNAALNLSNFLLTFNLQPFKEATVYYDCVVTSFNSSDKPHEASEQSITFKSSFAKRFGDNNAYDEYVRNVIAKNYLTKLSKEYNVFFDRMSQMQVDLKPTDAKPTDQLSANKILGNYT